MILATLLLSILPSWGGVGPSAPMAPPNATPTVVSYPGVLGAGGKISWAPDVQDEPTVRLDAQLVVRPIPRLILTGGWGRSERERAGADAPESTSVLTRWELSGAMVVVQGIGSGYIPLTWRTTRLRDNRLGDASWSSWGFGLGGLFPVAQPVWVRTEGLWMIDDRHDEPARGVGRNIKRSGLELGLGFVVFIR